MVARDAPEPFAMDVNTAYACLVGTAKPVSISASEPAHIRAIADICYSIAGGEVDLTPLRLVEIPRRVCGDRV